MRCNKFRAIGLLLSLLCVLNLSLVVGCKKPSQQPDEPTATYKKRLAGIYIGKAAIGLRTASDATAILVKAGRLSRNTALNIYNLDDRAALALGVVADRVRSGFPDPNDTIAKLDALLVDVQQLERLGVIELSDQAKASFIVITGGVRAALATLRAILLSQQQPSFTKDVVAAKITLDRVRLQANTPQWLFDLVQLILVSYGDAEALNNQLTVEGTFGAVVVILNITKSLNEQHRKELPA